MRHFQPPLGSSREISPVMVGFLAVGLFVLLASPVYAQTASSSPSTCANNASVGTSAWTIGAPLPATSVMPDKLDSNYLVCTGFGFSIPTGSAINGITATAGVNCSRGNQCQDGSIKIVNAGAIVGTEQAAGGFWPNPGTRTWGGSTNLWGVTWLATDIDSANFGMAISSSNKKGGGATTTATINSITLSVAYTLPPTVTKSFAPTTILAGNSSTLTITLTNPNATAITAAAMTDAYPANLVNASTPAGSTTCTGGTVTATAGGGSVALSGATIPASGSCTVTVSVTSSTAGSYNNNVPVGAVTFPNGGFNGSASNTATLTVNALVASFDAVEVGASPHTDLYTKLSGVNFSVDILALDSSNAVSTGYTGTVTLALVDASTGGGVCASMTSLQALGSLTFVAANAGRKTTASINYASAARNAKIRISDAVLGITSCSFDAFAIRPTSLTVASNMTNTATSGTPFVNAGGNFTLSATALAGYNGTPTIDNTKIAAQAGAIQIGSIAGVFSAALPATGVASGSAFTYSEVGNFQFLAQGVYDSSFTLVDQATGDCTSNFSNALVGGKYGCNFGNAAATSFFGRFTPDHFVISAVTGTNRSDLVCSPASTFTNMDEAMGLAFTLTAANSAGATTQNYTTASGSAKLNPTLPGYFNFVGKDSVLTSLRTFDVSAITNANPGQVTTSVAHGFVSGQQVYITGVNGMTQINGQLVTVTVINTTNFTVGVNTSGYGAYTSGGTVSRLAGLTSTGSWTAGVTNVNATVTLKRALVPDGPYMALIIGIAPRDDDGISLLSGVLNLDADNNGSNESYNVLSTQAWFGRLRVGNVFGTTVLNLPLALTTEYYNGSYFMTNSSDSCTMLAAANIGMAFVSGTNLVACQTALNPTGSIYFNAGQASSAAPPAAVLPPYLTKPPSGNSGAVDLTVNLDGTLAGNTCLAVGGVGPAVTNASKPYLQGDWGSGTYHDNPRGRATFGIFKNAPQLLYLRENY